MTTTMAPVRCAEWCSTGDGHPDAMHPDDQDCWGPDGYVELAVGRVGATPYRDVGRAPVVRVHVDLPEVVDLQHDLTAGEARAYAAALVHAADLIEAADPVETVPHDV